MPHPLVEHFFKEFYFEGQARHSPEMSSHWAKYSKKFFLKRDSGGASRIMGFGFGESDRAPSLIQSCAAYLEILSKMLIYFPDWEMIRWLVLGRSVVKSMGLHFGRDAFRQLCVLRTIKKNLPVVPAKILVIGDGPGILGAFLHKTWPKAEIVMVDLGVTLTIQAHNLIRAFPEAQHCEGSEQKRASFRYIPAERHALPDSFKPDLAINVASMQEMRPQAVETYFKTMRMHRTRCFYCCNRAEKVLPGGEVSRLADYPWLPQDQVLLEESPGWYGWFLGTAGRPLFSLGLLHFPWLRRYEGIHVQRLVRMATE